jgi:predicted N-acetyltransferase YhbS
MPALDESSIRAAQSADALAVAAVIGRAFEAYRCRLRPTPDVLSETAHSIAARLAAGQGFVAEAGGRVVACILTVANSAEELYVGRLAVHPAWQGCGLGTRLMEGAEQMARGGGFRRMSLGVRLALTHNRALFEKLGFRFHSAERHPGFAEPTYIFMRKEL